MILFSYTGDLESEILMSLWIPWPMWMLKYLFLNCMICFLGCGKVLVHFFCLPNVLLITIQIPSISKAYRWRNKYYLRGVIWVPLCFNNQNLDLKSDLFWLVGLLIFLWAHAKFRNPTTIPSGRKVSVGERKKEEFNWFFVYISSS